MKNKILKILLPFLFVVSKQGVKEEKGAPGGVATLDENGKIPHDQLPAACEIINGELILNDYRVTCEIENMCLNINT